MQRVARPPPPESVQKALEYAMKKPGSVVRILTLDNFTQRVVVLYKDRRLGRECPHYYDVELGRASSMSEYTNLGKGRIISSAPYKESEYAKSVNAFRDYAVLLSGGSLVK